jgi:RNA polymerase sigma-70 factor (ECF subfamily)
MAEEPNGMAGTEMELVPARERALAAVSIGGATALVVGPGLLAGWLMALVVGGNAAAELLQHSGGLVPTTFGAGWTIATAVNAVGLLAGLWDFAQRWKAPLLPSRRIVAKLAAFWSAGIAVLVPLDLAFGVDVPDAVTTAVLVGGVQLLGYVLPVTLARIGWRLVHAAWRTAMEDAARCRRMVALSSSLAFAGLGVDASLVAGLSTGYVPVEEYLEAEQPDERDAEVGLIESSRLGFVEMAEDLVSDEIDEPLPEGASASALDRDRLERCMRTLSERRGARSEVDWAIGKLVKGLEVPPPQAEDLAMHVLLKVCEQDARKGIQNVTPYYRRAVQNEAKTEMKRCRMEHLAGEGIEYLCELDDDSVPAEDLKRIRRAFATLNEAEQAIVRFAYIDGRRHAEIAEILNISESASRKRLERAVAKLRTAYRKQA